METFNENENAAGRYAMNRWRVFPLHSIRNGVCTCAGPDGKCKRDKPGKHPRIDDWANAATDDTGQIEAWWTQWPDANIGFLIPPACAVLDMDPRHGGQDSVAKLEKQYGKLPARSRQNTGGGGSHYL